MSYAKLIHEFLDEGLQGPQEDALFAELNQSPELRGEFNNQVKLHVIAQNDMSSIAPPLETTNALFASLGFSLPHPEGVQPAPAPEPVPAAGGSFKLFFGKYLSTILTAVISATVATFIVLNVNNNTPSESAALSESARNLKSYPVVSSVDNDIDRAANPDALLYNSHSNNSSISNAHHTAAVYQNRRNITTSVNNANNVNLTGLVANNTNGSSDGNLKDSHVLLDAGAINETNPEFAFTPGLNKTSGIYTPGQVSHNDLLKDLAETYNYELEVGTNGLPSLGGTSNPSIGMNPAGSNLSLTLLYNADENWSFGLTSGSDSYPMAFDAPKDGITQHFRQYPSLWYIGPTARYYARQFSAWDMITPYVQAGTAFAGGKGLLLKGGAGINFDLGRYVGINVGYEYSGLIYNVINTTYFSSKNGVTFGLRLKTF